MNTYFNPKYDPIRDYIKNQFKLHNNYNKTRQINGETEEEQRSAFDFLNSSLKWDIKLEDYLILVKQEWDSHQSTYPIMKNRTKGTVFTSGESNKFEKPSSGFTFWQLFKKKSLKQKNKFDDETIDNIENDVYNITQNLSAETTSNNPVKGLVIGGVQSGKTTNMAGLMAMGADFGFNIFIVLSGTIESLRLQTEDRLKELLEGTDKNRKWKNVTPINKHNNLIHDVYKKDANLYMVVLKNKKRLEDLIDWIQEEQYSRVMRVLIIDDEADQASVNTSEDPENERKTINRLIINLTHNKDKNDNSNNYDFESINYIGYTATPYANILSESPDSKYSLYPKNFIATLTESKSHFGPKEVFGLLEEDYDEMPIINQIEDSNKIKDLLNNKTDELPLDLKESIAYFIAGAASLRLHQFSKPVSMLIHVSNRIDHHNRMYDVITKWLSNDKAGFLEIAENVWERERSSLKISHLESRVNINKNTTLIKQQFHIIKNEVINIINIISPVEIDSTNKLVYHTGVHTILDHSQTRSDNSTEYRLNYPTHKNDLDKTPIFLVIGGTTLSRGITLEGLISTYFLRTTSTADTLTQMGRWFGYRINYELYPRVWLTNKTNFNFKLIASIESDLREEIDHMNTKGQDFSEFAPKILSMPQYIMVTSRNKSYAKELAEYDFSGYSAQTYIFDNDISMQQRNIEITESFINGLGKPNIHSNKRSNNIYWNNIAFNDIKEKLLKDFTFNERIKAFKSIEQMFLWIEEATKQKSLGNWNVILGGVGQANQPDNDWILDHISYNKVQRTKKSNFDYDDINIGVLRNVADLYGDINESEIVDSEIISILQDSNKRSIRNNYSLVREKLGLDKTPQLVIYKIDKDSHPTTEERVPLDIDTDIIGLYISIPGRKDTTKPIKITTRITKSLDDESFDI